MQRQSVLFSTVAPLQVPQDSPACPSDKRSNKMKMSTEYWCNDTERGKPQFSGENQSQCQFRSPSVFYLPVHSRCIGFLFSLDHTQAHTTVGRTPLDEGSARRRDLSLTTQTLYKRQTSIPPVGFEPWILASARPQTYASDGAATGIGTSANLPTTNQRVLCKVRPASLSATAAQDATTFILLTGT
jgi:hypothetical protein